MSQEGDTDKHTHKQGLWLIFYPFDLFEGSKQVRGGQGLPMYWSKGEELENMPIFVFYVTDLALVCCGQVTDWCAPSIPCVDLA